MGGKIEFRGASSKFQVGKDGEPRAEVPATARSILVKLPLEQLFDLVDGGGGVLPLGVNLSLLPGPAASIIRPMMLLPLTFSPSFSTKMSQANRLAVLTNMAAGRAWMPSLLTTVSSLVKEPSSFVTFLALIRTALEVGQNRRLRHSNFTILAGWAICAINRSFSSRAGLYPVSVSLVCNAATSISRAISRPGFTGNDDVRNLHARGFR